MMHSDIYMPAFCPENLNEENYTINKLIYLAEERLHSIQTMAWSLILIQVFSVPEQN